MSQKKSERSKSLVWFFSRCWNKRQLAAADDPLSLSLPAGAGVADPLAHTCMHVSVYHISDHHVEAGSKHVSHKTYQ